MARRGRAADLQAAKQRKQKKIAIVGGVLLLAALAFSVPRTMSMMSGGTNLPDEDTTAVATTPAAPVETPVSLEPPSLGGSAAAAPAPAGGEASEDSEPAPPASAGQLVSFSRFESKDPFSPQVSDATTASPAPRDPGAGKKPPGGAEVPGVSSLPIAAVISVDGAKETVAPGHDFPAASPLFRLVSLTKSHAAIAIAGGSLADGAATVKLVQGEPLTLMNTADGVRYELRLVSFIRGSAPAS